MRDTIQSAFAALILNARYNFSKMTFVHMTDNMKNNREKFVMFPRFVQMIINSQAPDLDKNENDIIKLKVLNNDTMRKMLSYRSNRGGVKTVPATKDLIAHLINPAYVCPPGLAWRNADEKSDEEDLGVRLDLDPDDDDNDGGAGGIDPRNFGVAEGVAEGGEGNDNEADNADSGDDADSEATEDEAETTGSVGNVERSGAGGDEGESSRRRGKKKVVAEKRKISFREFMELSRKRQRWVPVGGSSGSAAPRPAQQTQQQTPPAQSQTQPEQNVQSTPVLQPVRPPPIFQQVRPPPAIQQPINLISASGRGEGGSGVGIIGSDEGDADAGQIVIHPAIAAEIQELKNVLFKQMADQTSMAKGLGIELRREMI